MLKAIRSVVILTEDSDVINQLGKTFMSHDYSIIIEKSKIKSIIKILEQHIDLIILDTEDFETSIIDLVSIIQKTRPRLPIVVISEDNSIQMLRTLAQLGVFYCIIKPVRSSEIEKVLEAIERFKNKRKQMNSLMTEHLQK